MKDIVYFFKRKYWQIRNLIKWLPILWKQYDFDYAYAIEVFKFQLEKLAQNLDSDRAYSINSKHQAQRIRMILRLMTKVYDDDYACEYQDEIKRLYGYNSLEFKLLRDTDLEEITEEEGSYEGEDLYEASMEFRRKYTDKQLEAIEKHRTRLFRESQERQKRAHKLLWELVEHNIQGFWD